MSIVCLSNLFFVNKLLEHILFKGRYHIQLSSLLRRRRPPTNLSTSNRLQESLFREEVLRWILRTTLADSHDDRRICSLFLAKHKLRSMLTNNSLDSNHWSTLHLAEASENHLLETLRETPIGVSG